MRSQADDLAGQNLPAVIKRADGSEIHTEVVLSMFEHPLAGRVVVGIFRRRDDRKLQRWSELTSELLELLADAPIDDPPAERLLSTLGRRLDWDVTTLWTLRGDGEARVPPRLDARPERRPLVRPGEGGRPDQRERRPAPLGHGARRADLGERPGARASASPATGWCGTACTAPTRSRSATAARSSASSRCSAPARASTTCRWWS